MSATILHFSFSTELLSTGTKKFHMLIYPLVHTFGLFFLHQVFIMPGYQDVYFLDDSVVQVQVLWKQNTRWVQTKCLQWALNQENLIQEVAISVLQKAQAFLWKFLSYRSTKYLCRVYKIYLLMKFSRITIFNQMNDQRKNQIQWLNCFIIHSFIHSFRHSFSFT